MNVLMLNFPESLQGLDMDKKGGEGKKGKKKDSSSDEEPDPDAMDWWTKYHASIDTMVRVSPDFIMNFLLNQDLNICCLLSSFTYFVKVETNFDDKYFMSSLS